MTPDVHPTNASLSTMWAVKNYPDLNDFFRVSRQMGFQKIELNHQVDSAMLNLVNFDHVQFSSVHEPCPADIPTKELVDRDWLISSTDEDARNQGMQAVMKSIDLAHRLYAPVVVVHCGNVSHGNTLENKLHQLFQAGFTQSDEYLETKSQFLRYRQEHAMPRLEAVKRSLVELLDYAAGKQVKLGLENRYHFLDIPSLDEMTELLNLAAPDRLGFIYDVGHAQALDRLGFYPHVDWLKRYQSRMLGAHLHDVTGITDHKSPGLGEIDFKSIAPNLPRDAFRTVEVQPGNTLAQVNRGLHVLVEAGCINYL